MIKSKKENTINLLSFDVVIFPPICWPARGGLPLEMWWELASLFLQPYATAGFPCLLPQNERIEEFLSFLLRLFGLQVGLVDLVCWWRSRSRNVLRAEKKTNRNLTRRPYKGSLVWDITNKFTLAGVNSWKSKQIKYFRVTKSIKFTGKRKNAIWWIYNGNMYRRVCTYTMCINSYNLRIFHMQMEKLKGENWKLNRKCVQINQQINLLAFEFSWVSVWNVQHHFK